MRLAAWIAMVAVLTRGLAGERASLEAGQEGLLYPRPSIDFHPDGLNDDDDDEDKEGEEKIREDKQFFPFQYYERFPSTGRQDRREIVDNYRPNSSPEFSHARRAFNPWGGKKRYFNPWGGKRVWGVRVERKTDSVFDKRPGFQPWGGKRGEKRAFNPWGGKRDSSPLRSRDFRQ